MSRSADAVIVTGASGFIGGAIGRAFQQQGFAVTGVARKPVAGCGFPVRVADYAADSIAALVAEVRPAALVHAAGTASVGASITDPAQDYAGSVQLFWQVLEGVRRSGLRPRVAFISSAAVYGQPETLPIAEDAQFRPISPYGHHKVMCETLAAEYASCFGVPALVLRAFSVFGAGQRRLLVWDLFRKFRDDAEVVLDGTGEEARDYVHVEDLAAHSAELLRALREINEVVNIGSTHSVTVHDLARLVGRLLGSSKPVAFTGRQRGGDPKEWRADMSRYHALTGKGVVVDLERRLEQVLRQWRA